MRCMRKWVAVPVTARPPPPRRPPFAPAAAPCLAAKRSPAASCRSGGRGTTSPKMVTRALARPVQPGASRRRATRAGLPAGCACASRGGSGTGWGSRRHRRRNRRAWQTGSRPGWGVRGERRGGWRARSLKPRGRQPCASTPSSHSPPTGGASGSCYWPGGRTPRAPRGCGRRPAAAAERPGPPRPPARPTACGRGRQAFWRGGRGEGRRLGGGIRVGGRRAPSAARERGRCRCRAPPRLRAHRWLHRWRRRARRRGGAARDGKRGGPASAGRAAPAGGASDDGRMAAREGRGRGARGSWVCARRPRVPAFTAVAAHHAPLRPPPRHWRRARARGRSRARGGRRRREHPPALQALPPPPPPPTFDAWMAARSAAGGVKVYDAAAVAAEFGGGGGERARVKERGRAM